MKVLRLLRQPDLSDSRRLDVLETLLYSNLKGCDLSHGNVYSTKDLYWYLVRWCATLPSTDSYRPPEEFLALVPECLPIFAQKLGEKLEQFFLSGKFCLMLILGENLAPNSLSTSYILPDTAISASHLMSERWILERAIEQLQHYVSGWCVPEDLRQDIYSLDMYVKHKIDHFSLSWEVSSLSSERGVWERILLRHMENPLEGR